MAERRASIPKVAGSSPVSRSKKSTRVRFPSPASGGYNLWNPPPWEERQQALAGLKIDPKAKVDEKKLQAAIEASEKKFAFFKPQHLTDLEWATMMLRPICDH
jgi:hypothetical protein